ncbi:uncharacterized protein LOC128724945 [Anopheles nili]|uniref:uncharacterized protein LOC128724945 n=1 Tax=Anopheles nili TaxID=185578 RepID=UPI00237A0DB5|nr:uncharacterized protein LOC128724945 [Anopheles nili]
MQLQRQGSLLVLLVGTVMLLLITAHVDVTQAASIYAPDFNESSAHFIDQQRSCRDLCSFCPTCNGFYCGEECICECRQDPTEHAKCIDQIKANSEKLGLVYDLFIQLPQMRSSRTRFGRRAKTPEEKDDAGRIGFHKILFSNFATMRASVQEQPPIGEQVMLHELSSDPRTDDRTTVRDPLEKPEVLELLFSNGT